MKTAEYVKERKAAIDARLKELEKEWDRLDSQGQGEERQRAITEEMKKLGSEKDDLNGLPDE